MWTLDESKGDTLVHDGNEVTLQLEFEIRALSGTP